MRNKTFSVARLLAAILRAPIIIAGICFALSTARLLAGNVEQAGNVTPLVSALPTSLRCPADIEGWQRWRDDAVAALLQLRLSQTGEASVDTTQVMTQSVQIANFIDDCGKEFPDQALLTSTISNLRRFTSNLRNNLSAPAYDHQFGYTIDDFSYLERVRDNIDLPPLLRSAEFLTAVSNRETYKKAYDLIDAFNKTLPDDKKWKVFLYKSRFLTTPDDANTFGRFFVYVPGDNSDKWIQFGIKIPGDTSTIPINNLSIVSVAKPDEQGRRFNAIADWWRTYPSGWTPKLATRRETQGITENCIMCHKTSPLGIHPEEEYTFDAQGHLIVDTINQGKTPAFLNSLIAGYGAPYFNEWADPADYGPPLGPADLERSDTFMAACTSGFALDQTSVSNVRANMACDKCHTDNGVGVLNFPAATRHPKLAGNQIYQYITQGWMPPKRNLNPMEREALFSCLTQEYFDLDNRTGLFIDWLKNQSPPAVLMLAAKVMMTTGSGLTDFDQNCGDCHPKTAGTNDVGPTLFAVVGRKAGSVPGYSYSPSYVEAGSKGVSWSEDELSNFLTSPLNYLSGKLGHPASSKMKSTFPDATLRKSIIDYLKILH